MILRGWAGLLSLSLSLSLVACGGALGDNATSTDSDAGGPTTDASPGPEDSAAGDSTRPSPSTGVVWVRAEAAGFDPMACSASQGSDMLGLIDYISAQIADVGMTLAPISCGGGFCAFGTKPTSLTNTYVYSGTVAAAQALKSKPPAPYHGRYVTVPVVVKDVLRVKFEFFIGDTSAHAFDRVWVHDGLDFAGEASFMNAICNEKEAFDAAIAASPLGPAVEAWLRGRSGSGYELGYDATFFFDDGTSARSTGAAEASSGPYFAACPNVVSP